MRVILWDEPIEQNGELVWATKWDEADHPREPAGSADGGQFTAGGGGTATAERPRHPQPAGPASADAKKWRAAGLTVERIRDLSFPPDLEKHIWASPHGEAVHAEDVQPTMHLELAQRMGEQTHALDEKGWARVTWYGGEMLGSRPGTAHSVGIEIRNFLPGIRTAEDVLRSLEGTDATVTVAAGTHVSQDTSQPMRFGFSFDAPDVETALRMLRQRAAGRKEWRPEDHPRAPAGSAEGGQFTEGGGGAATAVDDRAAVERWRQHPELSVERARDVSFASGDVHAWFSPHGEVIHGDKSGLWHAGLLSRMDETEVDLLDRGYARVTWMSGSGAIDVAHSSAGIQTAKTVLQVMDADGVSTPVIVYLISHGDTYQVVGPPSDALRQLRTITPKRKAITKAPGLPDLVALSSRLAPEMRQAFLDAVDATRTSIPLDDLARAVQTGDLTEAEALLDLDSLTRSLEAKWAPILRQGFTLGVEAGLASLRPVMTAGFDLTSPSAVAWASSRAGDLVTEVTDDTRAAIRNLVTQAYTQGVDVRVLARQLTHVVGLRSDQINALSRFQADLIDGGMDVEETGPKVEKYANQLLKARGELIARNEVLKAGGEGQQQQWQQAIEAGLIDPGTTMKRWITAEDERTCPVCRPLDGLEVPIGEQFPGGFDHPPDPHIQCRCVLGLVFPSAGKGWRVKWDEGQHPRVPSGSSTGGDGGAVISDEEAPKALRALTTVLGREFVTHLLHALGLGKSAATWLKDWDRSRHPREPAGSSEGGQFTSAGSGGGRAPAEVLDRIVVRARKLFKPTDNQHHVGYILLDGTPLDIFGDDRSSHGLAAQAMLRGIYQPERTWTHSLIESTGFVRWHPNNGAEFIGHPTDAQLQRIVRFAREDDFPGKIALDYTPLGTRNGGATAMDRPTVEKIRTWIGEIDEQSKQKEWREEDHPRVPAGSEAGGQFTAGGGGTAVQDGGAREEPAHIPEADTRTRYEVNTVEEAYSRLTQGQRVLLAKPAMVSTLLDKLAAEARAAKAAGTKAPRINLCDVSVKGSNLFCEDSLGVERVNMPQLEGKPLPGGPADLLPKDEKGRVNLGETFTAHLAASGVHVTHEDIPASYLKATQRELDGVKVAEIMQRFESGTARDRRIFISRDNYVIDGHHNWAARIGQDFRSSSDSDLPMKVARIDLPILDVLVRAGKYVRDMKMHSQAIFTRTSDSKGFPFRKDWREEDHPRVPAGSESGGQFAAGNGGVVGFHGTGQDHLASILEHGLQPNFSPGLDTFYGSWGYKPGGGMVHVSSNGQAAAQFGILHVTGEHGRIVDPDPNAPLPSLPRDSAVAVLEVHIPAAEAHRLTVDPNTPHELEPYRFPHGIPPEWISRAWVLDGTMTPTLDLSGWKRVKTAVGGDGDVVLYVSFPLAKTESKALTAGSLADGGAIIPDPSVAPAAHEFGTVQAILPPAAGAAISSWVFDNLDPADVLELPDAWHVTVRYGIAPGVTSEDVAAVGPTPPPFSILISGLQVFEGAEEGTRDVLVALVASEDQALERLHDQLGQLPHVETQDQYIPHVTLAYLGLGAGERVLDGLAESPHVMAKIDRLEFRAANGASAPIPLTGGETPLADMAGNAIKDWREEDHPRHPAGTGQGGEFAPAGGGHSGSASLPHSRSQEEIAAESRKLMGSKHPLPGTAEYEKQVNDYIAAVDKIPEVQQAEREIASGRDTLASHRDSAGLLSLERAHLHEQIVDSMLNPYAVPVEGRPRAVLLMGMSGSGKSTTLRPLVGDLSRYTVIDADAIRAQLPEYTGHNTPLTQSEASYIAEEKLLPRAIKAGMNIVFDGTGKNSDKYLRLADALYNQGYNVEALYAQVNPLEAMHRATGRYLKPSLGGVGRYTPLRFIRDIGERPLGTYNGLKEQGHVTRLVRYDTNTDTPIRLEDTFWPGRVRKQPGRSVGGRPGEWGGAGNQGPGHDDAGGAAAAGRRDPPLGGGAQEDLEGANPDVLKDWREEDHPRAPAGSSEGGQFTAGGGGGAWSSPTPEEFVTARDASARGALLSHSPPEELAGHRLFLAHGGTVGVSVSPDGDIQNVFNNGGPKGGGVDALAMAIAHGGRTLDCYAPYLPKLYGQMGFVETGRMHFDPAYAPPGWDFKRYGQPDVVFMAWRGYGEGGEAGAVERARGDRGKWIDVRPSGHLYPGDQWDAAKSDSRRAAVDRGPGGAAGSTAHGGGGESGDRAGQVHGHALAKEFREEDHPRVPAGSSSGGQFAAGGGGGAGSRVDELHGPDDTYVSIDQWDRWMESSHSWTVPTAQAAVHPDQVDWASRVTRSIGWNGELTLKHGDGPPFTLAGNQLVEAGHYDPRTDAAVVFLDAMSPSHTEAVIAHEATHGLFNAAMEELKRQDTAVTNLAATYTPSSRTDHWPYTSISDDRLQPDAAAQFPLYAAHRAVFNDTLVMQRTGSAVSPYAARWWEAWRQGKANTDQATNETIAEISVIESLNISSHATPKDRAEIMARHHVTPEWLAYHDEIVKAGRAHQRSATAKADSPGRSIAVIGPDGWGEQHESNGVIRILRPKGA